ncbi:hypothetical protein [Chlamydia avium]|uniref:Membrane protein n=1 Tax=Chlamydia avium TaxID=1457141 RepID=A0ABP2X5Y6_9CHLA|nr:hypothetical protein [Chlamydia avium]EPP37333.1 putative membrane protein [Chlamydia psittaci 10_743_SC13]EPP38221.1 putative membrane protein [Chlamydia avium]
MGFGGISSDKLYNKHVYVNICRVFAALLAIITGLGALICGIGVCTAATFSAMGIAGVASIILSLVLISLAIFWSYGVFLSFRGNITFN